MHQMRLTETYTAVKIKRVISLSRGLSDSQRRCVSELIAGAYNKTIKGVL